MRQYLTLFIFFITAYAVPTNLSAQGLPQNIHLTEKFWEHYSGKSGHLSTQRDLFEEIREYLQPRYSDIGAGLVGNILQRRGQFDLGESNYSGLNWQKPMGSYGIAIDRQLAPDLFHDTRFIVSDTFTVYIDAQTYIGELVDEGLVELTEETMRAFAGIQFKREFRSVHFAPSYVEGLSSRLDKLFLGFLGFHRDQFENMELNEFVTKTDLLSVRIGALATVPIGYGLGVGAGAVAIFDRMASVTLSRQEVEGTTPWIIQYEKELGREFKAKVSLELDFLNLLKITLLSSEVSYSWSEKQGINLAIPENFFDDASSSELSALNRVLRMRKPDKEILGPYITSLEDRRKESQSKLYQTLHKGKLRKYQTEQIVINNDEEETVFFRHHSLKESNVKDITSNLISAFFRRIFGLPFKGEYKAKLQDKFSFEFKSSESDAPKLEDIKVETQRKVSLVIDKKLELAKKARGSDWRDISKSMMNAYGYFPEEVVNGVATGKLTSPLTVETKESIKANGIDYFRGLTPYQGREATRRVCRHYSDEARYEWRSGARKPPRRRRRVASEREECEQKLEAAFMNYFNGRDHYGRMHLWGFRKFLSVLLEYRMSAESLNPFFGERNIFRYGKIKAVDQSGKPFQSYYRNGNVNEGEVDIFRRVNRLQRSPAAQMD